MTEDTKPKVKPDDDIGARFLTISQVQRKTRLAQNTILDEMNEGRFPAARVVRHKLLFLDSEVDQWMVNQPVVRLEGGAR